MTGAGLILILKDGKPRQEIDLTWGQHLSMGTHPSNSIILPDKGIQSEHMKLLVNEEGQAVFDSFGHNNVLVNGRVEQGPVTLNDGDLIEVLRKHHGPRQFVYYSKSSGQTSAACKSSQQEQWLLKGPGPSETSLLASKAPRTSPVPPALPGQTTQTCMQPPRPAPQQQFAMPPPAPPCPPGPRLRALTRQQVTDSRSQGTQSAQLHVQHQDWPAPGVAKAPAALPPVPPPLPPLPWAQIQTSHGAAIKDQQACQQHQQSSQKHVQLHLAPAPLAPPLPPLPSAKHIITSLAPADTLPQQPLRAGSSAQFAQPPVPPPPPPHPKQSKGSSKAKLSCGKPQDVGVKQQHKPNSGAGNAELKGPSTSSDVHRLVAQQAAAAALTRRQHREKPEHNGQLAQAAAATPADSEADKLATLQHHLLQKCGEIEALQEQNMQLQAQVDALQKCGKAEALQAQNFLLQAQVNALQQQLVSSSTAGCLAQVQGLQEQANCADNTLEGLEAAQELVEPTVVLQFPSQTASGMHHNQAAACATDTAAQAQEDSMSNGGTMQHPTHSQGTGCCPAQACSQMTDSLEHSTVAQPEQVKHAHVPLAPCLQPMAAVSRSPDGTVQQQSDASRSVKVAMLSGGTDVHADAQQATDRDGQTGSPEGQAAAPDGQTGSPEGQATLAEGQAAKSDWQGSAAADVHDATADRHTALTDGMPAHLSDTISEACCVCNCAEDGEVMLLCDKCDEPAHLGCVGVDTVPEGDWFCPPCTSVMVLQSNGQQTADAAARLAAPTEAGAGRRQGSMEASQDDVDADAAGQGFPRSNKQQAGKKRKGAPSSADDTGANEVPSRKRSKRSVPAAQGQAGKENMAANAASKKQRQGKRASQLARRATCDEADMDSCGPRRSTRLAHK